MDCPIIHPADFRVIGYERIDTGTRPRVLLFGLSFDDKLAYLHFAGDRHIRFAPIADAVKDNDLIDGMEPHAAMRLGMEWARAEVAVDE